MTTLNSYDLNGKKLSFANWISNLSPMDVPFTSMTGKEAIHQTLFQWQTDSLAKAAPNAVLEGNVATIDKNPQSTTVLNNVTQILRKVVKVSDTANALANYGRGKELEYQMEKAGKEIKRDLEHAFLFGLQKNDGASAVARETAGFIGLCAVGHDNTKKVDLTSSNLKNLAGATDIYNNATSTSNGKDPDTGAVTVFKVASSKAHGSALDGSELTEKDIFDMTYNLYLAGSDADIIMYHPRWASMFSGLQEKAVGQAATRMRIFENTPKYSAYVSTIVDPLGREYKLIPNRWMPETVVYFFSASDWTQMVLRAPQRTKLAKDGSYEKWMIEMEVGLRHRNPFASGVLVMKEASAAGAMPGPGGSDYA